MIAIGRVVAWATPAILAGAVQAQCAYEVIPVYHPNPAKELHARSIGNDGTIVGFESGVQGRALVVSPKGDVSFLPSAQWGAVAEGIAPDGRIVGMERLGLITQLPVEWVDGTLVHLATPPGFSTGYALAANRSGRTVGFVNLNGGQIGLSAVWIDGAFVDISRDVPESGEAVGVTEDGVVVGLGKDPSTGLLVPYRWAGPGAVEFLPSIAPDLQSWPTAMSSNGFVAGYATSVSSSGFRHAVAWMNGTAIDCGVLAGYDKSSASGVNVFGQVAGVCEFSSPPPADAPFLWQDGVLYDLFELQLSPFMGSIASVQGINDRGEICGFGKDQYGKSTTVILRPLRTRPGDVTIDCHVDGRDLAALFEFWGRSYDYDGGPGDLDGDRFVGAFDLALVLGDWGP